MNARRQFLVSVPIGLAGMIAACKNAGPDASAEPHATLAGSAASTQNAPLAVYPADPPTLRWIPKHCFDGAAKTAADLPSKVMTPGHDNPQTGPFYIEGAEPGDTVAVHIIKLEPARSYAVSSFGPGFGALVGSSQTAMLGPDFPETTWRYDIDAKRNVAIASSRNGSHTWAVPLAPFLGCLGVAPAGSEVRTTIVPGPFGVRVKSWARRSRAR